MTVILALIGGLLLFAFLTLVQGWAFGVLFNAVVPIFWHAAPHLTFWQGLITMTLVNMLKSDNSSVAKK